MKTRTPGSLEVNAAAVDVELSDDDLGRIITRELPHAQGEHYDEAAWPR